MRSLVCLFALLLTSTALATSGRPDAPAPCACGCNGECGGECGCANCTCAANTAANHRVSYGILRGGPVFCRDAKFMQRGPVRRVVRAVVVVPLKVVKGTAVFFREVKPVRRALRFTGRVLTLRGPIASRVRACRCN